jgi:hypothetical protein
MADLAAPNPGNYTFGAHSLSIAGVDLGNIVNANVAVTVEEISHFSALSGDDVEDANIIRRIRYEVSVTLDEPNKTNMFRFFMADATGKVGMAATAAVAAVFAGIPISGNAFSWAIPKCYVRPNGNFGYNKDDWTQFELLLKLVADPNAPLAPYGTITHTGV